MVTYNSEAVFQALADVTRRDILDLLKDRELAAGEVAGRFPVSRPAVSRHLRVLREAGLVTQRKDAQTRYYRLNPDALRTVDQWLAHYRVFWSARLTDLKRLVEGLS
ncbi:MAG: metalloregulator ArsR/SmtB family transcription factor [Gemmatimonadales bacterium]